MRILDGVVVFFLAIFKVAVACRSHWRALIVNFSVDFVLKLCFLEVCDGGIPNEMFLEFYFVTFWKTFTIRFC